MISDAIGLLAVAISAPICAVLMRYVPQTTKPNKHDRTRSAVQKELCNATHNALDERLELIEYKLSFPKPAPTNGQRKEPHP